MNLVHTTGLEDIAIRKLEALQDECAETVLDAIRSMDFELSGALLKILDLHNEKSELLRENEQLKSRIEYLEDQGQEAADAAERGWE